MRKLCYTYIMCVLAIGVMMLPGAALAQSLNVSLLSLTDDKPTQDYNDCWGFVGNNGDEYAIIGYTNGTLFYRVTDPANPVLVGDISGVGSIWRDMKVNGDYCYIVTEGPGGGVQVVSLVNPNSPSLVATHNNFTAHNIQVDTVTQRIYVCGTGSGDDLRIIDVGTDPVNISQVGSWDGSYSHDLYVKNDKAYLGNIYDSKFTVLDVSNPASASVDGSLNYGQSSHATWLLDSNPNILITADEQSNGIIRAWDITNLGNIQALGSWGTGSGTSVHNVFSIGDLVYASYYTEGLRIISFADPNNPVEVGYYDTYPGTGLYAGNWGAYPFLPSGTIIASDMQSGLFLLSFDSPAILTGTVTDMGGSFPVPALVTAGASSGSTNASGDYSFTATGGSQSVITSAYGFISDTTTVNIATSGPTTHDVNLVALPGASISGVTSESGGGTLSGVSLTLTTGPRSDVSDGGGNYELEYVPVGAHTVEASKFGYNTESKNVNVADGVTSTANFDLTPAWLVLDMEANPNWSVGDAGDGAFTGVWARVNPNGTGGGTVQPEDDHTETPGVNCWITGQSGVGAGIGDNDVDGGKTTLLSGTYDVTSLTDPKVTYHRWFVNDAGSNPGAEPWVVHISNDGGSSWATVESTHTAAPTWTEVTFLISDYVTPTSQVKLRFIARDIVGSIVEAGVDDFAISGTSTSTGIADGSNSVPSRIGLGQNRPNPFNPTTSIEFSIPSRTAVDLSVYEPSGRLVKSLVRGSLDAGRHSVLWNGTDDNHRPVSSGIYLYQLRADGEEKTKKLILVR